MASVSQRTSRPRPRIIPSRPRRPLRGIAVSDADRIAAVALTRLPRHPQTARDGEQLPGRHRRRRRHAVLRLRRRRDPRRLHALDAAVRRLPARHSLRAQGQLDARDRPAAAGARQQRDANSMGEVDVALRCGFQPRQIMFTGVGKSADELDRAVALGLKAINVESPGELDRLDQRAGHRAPSRASRCASTPTSTRRATRTSPPGSRPTSSACRSTPRRRCSARFSAARA